MHRTFQVVAAKSVLVVVAAILALGAVELFLRVRHSDYDLFSAGYEKPWFREGGVDLAKLYEVDSEFGFRPFVPGPFYNEFGTLRNDYPAEKVAGRTRLLFVGDSVTRYGFIVEALKQVYGEEDFEYWNAGVESFNTVQQLNFYRRFNRNLKPDHVILTFHNNDFETTPIVFLNEKQQLVLFSPFLPRDQVNGWLFRHSHLYRLWIGWRIAIRKEAAREAIEAEVRESLRVFAEACREDGTRFTVLVHPVLAPRAEWKTSEIANHAAALAILNDLGIRYFDLSEPLWPMLEEGLDPKWDMWKNDKAHPNAEAARRFAVFLKGRDLL